MAQIIDSYDQMTLKNILQRGAYAMTAARDVHVAHAAQKWQYVLHLLFFFG